MDACIYILTNCEMKQILYYIIYITCRRDEVVNNSDYLSPKVYEAAMMR